MSLSGLQHAIDAVERRRKRLDVYAADADVASELEAQFETRNVTVEHRPAAAFDDGFVAVRDADGTFRGTLGLAFFDAVVSPETHPPWRLDDDVDARTLFEFLEHTLFASYDRRQMLAASREIEDRAWRVGNGRLYAGFQRSAAFDAQRAVYDRLASREALTVAAFVDDDWPEATDDPTVVSADGEIGRFWFVAFDGGDADDQQCALIARERQPGEYYGFWTYDPELVDDLFDHLETSYDVPGA